MRSLLTYGLFPAVFAGALTAGWAGLRAGLRPELILAAVTLLTVAVVAVVERIHPAWPSWNRGRGDVGTDALHAAVSMVALPQLLEPALRVGLLGVGLWLAGWMGSAPWPHAWPLMAQLALAMVISQLFEYWAHRLMHEWGPLWRLHAVHHSPGRLYWLNAGRFHPMDTLLSFTVSQVPLIVLGMGPELLTLMAIWIAVHGLFQHANIKVRLGPLNYLFSMAELHRWHHSRVLEEANANYGNNILLWDLVFGTVYWPRHRDAAEAVGFEGDEDFPPDYLGQLRAPFRWPGFR